MKVCVIGPTYPFRGGIAHYTTLMVKHLREAGHATRLFSFTRQYPQWLFPGKTDKDPSAAPLKIACEYVLDPINPLTWWSVCYKIRAEKPDIVILQWWQPYWTPCLTMIGRWLKRNTQTRIVFIVHNVVPHEGGGFIDRRLAITVLYKGDAFIVHSEQDKHRLHALLPNIEVYKTQLPTFLEVAPPTGKLPTWNLMQRLKLPDDVPILLFFGFVRPYKGLEYLIQALSLVLKQRKVHLLVVGEFWASFEFYVQYAQEFNVQHAITFLNEYVPNEELSMYFDLAEVVVMPYISATQSGIVQLAYGFGKPVITTRVGGLHEVVQDGVTGLIVPPQDEVALAAAIERFFAEELAEKLTPNVQRAAHAQIYSWQHLIQILEQASHPAQTS